MRMKTLERIPTGSMSHDEWLAARRNSIGGSDAATVLGKNPYSSPFALWAEKTGTVEPEDISDREAVRLGTDLEQYVAMRWTEATGHKVQRTNFIYKHPNYPFAHANPDRLLVKGGRVEGLECKTTSNWDYIKQLRAGEIPAAWYCQCVHYMMVMDAARWHLAAIAFGDGFYHFTIERDEAEIAALAEVERNFWQLVQTKTPPPVDGSEATGDTLKVIFKDSAPGTAIDLGGVASAVERYNGFTAQIKELETLQAEAENEIKQYMGDAEKGRWGNTTVSWKSTKRKTFDKKRYEIDYGKIEDEYYTETVSRRFTVSLK